MRETIGEILREVERVVVGKRAESELLLAAILAGGHVLIDDVPGVGKTTLALAVSRALGLTFRRVQFTPDVLPTDITGFSVFDRSAEAAAPLRYVPGVVTQCNILLGDEINRTSSKTQSALLEAMEEGQVTVDGATHALKSPFTVIATQNNVGTVGTQPLPYAQMDRFLLKLTLGYPDFDSQMEILRDRRGGNPLDEACAVTNEAEVLAMRRESMSAAIVDEVLAYIARLCVATREHSACEMGVSPRGALLVSRMARAWAFVQGRDFATPQDVRTVFPATCAHRILVRPDARARGATSESVIADALAQVAAPDSAR